MQAFGLRAVVLTRNLYDVVVSLRDYYTAGAIRGTRFEVDAWMQAEPARQLDQIIDLVVPWHLEFLAAWQRAAQQRRVPVLWLDYATLMRDKLASVQRVLNFYGITLDNVMLAAAIAQTEAAAPEKNRFNRGVNGRGAETLSAAQKQRIKQLAGYYPATDFTRYGLG